MVNQEQTTKAKLRALSQGVRVWMLEAGRRYVSPNRTNEGVAYEIVVQSQEAGDVTCTCKGSSHRGICRHVGAVLLRLEVEQELGRTSRPASSPQDSASNVSDLYQ
jgi:hypothetical protein